MTKAVALTPSTLSGLRGVAVVFTGSRLTAFGFVGAFRAVALVQLPHGFKKMVRFTTLRAPCSSQIRYARSRTWCVLSAMRILSAVS